MRGRRSTRAAEHQQRNARHDGSLRRIRRDAARERVGRIHDGGDAFRPQEVRERLRAAEPAYPHRSRRQSRVPDPSGERRQHVSARGEEGGGQFAGLAGPAENEDAHERG